MTLAISPITDSVSNLLYVIDSNLVSVLPKPRTTRTAKGLILSGAQCDDARDDANGRRGSGDVTKPKRKAHVHAKKWKGTKPSMQLRGHTAKAYAKLVRQRAVSNASWNDQYDLADPNLNDGSYGRGDEFDEYWDHLNRLIDEDTGEHGVVVHDMRGEPLMFIVEPGLPPRRDRWDGLLCAPESEGTAGYDDAMNHRIANGEELLSRLDEEYGINGHVIGHRMDDMTRFEFHCA